MSVFWIALAAGIAGAVLIVGVVAWLVWRRADREARALIERIMRLPLRDKFRLALRLARDGRVPLPVRAIPPALVLYLSTPIDLIPDFIPVLGHVDDVVVALVGVALLLRFVPRNVLEEELARLETGSASLGERTK